LQGVQTGISSFDSRPKSIPYYSPTLHRGAAPPGKWRLAATNVIAAEHQNARVWPSGPELAQRIETEQVAEKVHVSPKSVDIYRARIKEKLAVSNMSEEIRRATQ
jgi:hypothetical protein